MRRLLPWKRSDQGQEDQTHTRRKVLAGGALGVGTGLLWPVGAQAQDPIDDRYVLRERSPINVKDYGATGDGTTDDLAAINSAIAALPASGGTIFFPRGAYACSGTLNFDRKRSVVLAGEGGLTGGSVPASRIGYTGTGANFVSARSTTGFTIRDLAVGYTQSGFTGALVDLSHAPATQTQPEGGDTQLARIEGAMLGSGGPSLQSALLLNLDKAISSSFTNVSFSGGDVAVRGRAAANSYSNVIAFRSCMFVYQKTMHAKNAGQSWSFDGCTFELLYPAGAPGGAGAYMQDSGYITNALSFHGCWFGDANSTGTWIQCRGAGISVRSCYFGHGARGVLVDGPSTFGVDISANSFDSMTKGVEFTGVNNADVVVLANLFNGVTSPILLGAPLLNGILQSDTPGVHCNHATRGMLYTGGPPLDSYWQGAPANGTFYLDSSNHRLYVRDGGAWRWTALT